jgi:GxxExxY protein
MRIIDGKKIAAEILAKLKSRPAPKKFLAVFLVGDSPASLSFIKQKEKVAKELGVDFRLYKFPPEIKNDELRGEIRKIVDHKTCGGAIVQLPLPEHINAQYVLNVIPREKDIDVLGERALGAFYAGRNPVLPPAVGVVEEILKESQLYEWHPNATNKTRMIIEKELSYKVNGIFFQVHDDLGRYCTEKQYGDVLEKKLKQEGISYKREQGVSIGGRLSNFVDFIVEDKIAIDLKAKPFVTKEDYFQMKRYLEATGLELGLIVNFRSKYLRPKRILNSKIGSGQEPIRIASEYSDMFVGLDYLSQMRVVVVGRGSLVGRPAAVWLMGRAKELVVLGRGGDLSLLKDADLVVLGAGIAGLVKPEMLKPGAGVIDFGYDGGRGDFDPNQTPDARHQAPGWYTPTPGGTGPILVAKLFENFFKLNAAE